MIEIPQGYSLYGARARAGGVAVGYIVIPFIADEPVVWCIMKPDAKGGWHYRSRWAAEAAFQAWDGAGAPMAGEWRDFK